MSAFDYQYLRELAAENNVRYKEAMPFPHLVIDNFISKEMQEQLIHSFPEIKDRINHDEASEALEDGTVAQYGKRWLSMEMRVNVLIRKLYWELNSAPFLRFLEELTGISGLIPDPHLVGGGLHETRKDGFLMVHSDYNKHPEYHLDRRLNLLIYLNPVWDKSYGGELELWDTELTRCEKKILPIAGRCVIFSTTRNSFHGHPEPLTCPEEVTRRSLALYYYTNGRPKNENDTPHLTLWKKV